MHLANRSQLYLLSANHLSFEGAHANILKEAELICWYTRVILE